MQIRINSTSTAGDVQQVFNQQYPFLKLEMYKFGTGRFDTDLKIRMAKGTFLRSAASAKEGSIKIDDSMTATTLEQQFLRTFGLTVEVKLKSGHRFTLPANRAMTTLTELNEQGEQLARK